MAKAIRVGVIGCGKIANVSHVPSLASLRGVKLTALCDIDASKMKALQERNAPKAELYTNYKELLKSDLDAVSICTPNDLHVPMSLDALKAGLHVLCEKPMAPTVAEATRMIKAAKKAKKVLQINQSLRYSPHYYTLVKLVTGGSIGEPIHARCIRACRATPNVGWSPGADWFVSKKHNGGIILDIAIHMADILRWTMGDVKEVSANVDTRTPGIDVIDTVSALFRFQNGGTGVLELSWAFAGGANLLEVYGTKGKILMGFSDKPIQLVQVGPKGREVTYPELKKNLPNSFQGFVKAIRGKAESRTPGELGRISVAICEAIREAGQRQKVVKVKRFRS